MVSKGESLNSKNWYFLGFGSLVAWVFFLSQPFVGVPGPASGFDLIMNFVFEGGSYLDYGTHVAGNLYQALIITAVFTAISITSIVKAKALDSGKNKED